MCLKGQTRLLPHALSTSAEAAAISISQAIASSNVVIWNE
jgi:hypothetical protein